MSLAHLFSILREEFVLVAELTFYADESGIHDPHGIEPGSQVASIAGYIATKAQWRTLERRWNTALTKYKVPEFHMSVFHREKHGPDSPYFRWSDAKRKRFLRLLIKIASQIPVAGYGSMVETKAWDSILDNYAKVGVPQGKKKGEQQLIYNPYISCFQNFFAKFPKFLNEAVNPLLNKRSPVTNVAFVFHRHQVFGPAAQIGYDISLDVLKDARLGTIAFSPSRDCPPLQAADLLAFYSRRRFARYLEKIPADEFERQILEPDPRNSDRVYLIHLSRENLLDLQQNSEKVRVQRP